MLFDNSSNTFALPARTPIADLQNGAHIFGFNRVRPTNQPSCAVGFGSIGRTAFQLRWTATASRAMVPETLLLP
ncbi:hypothetical protein [Aquincola tertiaricarbonis]|uniref:hypothetical protein n=1 Tax=Aquincola tertiaricarbonis TaxID=391953 RepID=UPI000614DC49|nr:hypothetical protein [Aquincola tertiaricarbonis]